MNFGNVHSYLATLQKTLLLVKQLVNYKFPLQLLWSKPKD